MNLKHDDDLLLLGGEAGEPDGFLEFNLDSTPPPSSETAALKQIRRAAVSADAVMTASEVIEMVGGRTAVVRDWLRRSVLPLRHPSGRKVFRWGDVLEAMQRAS